MIINPTKSKVMLFNKSRKWDFPPELSFSDRTNLEYVSEMKLVGVVLSDDLRWSKNTQYICDKAMQKMWTLRRMKKLGLEEDIILDVYIKEIRSILEMAVPVWHSGLTVKQTRDIERVQKNALFIILAENYHDYDVACAIMSVEPLFTRRESLCMKFAVKDLKKESTLFTKSEVNIRNKKPVIEPNCNTKRFRQSSIPYLSRLLNSK